MMSGFIYTGSRSIDMNVSEEISLWHLPLLEQVRQIPNQPERLCDFQWIWFTSAFGVEAFFGANGYLQQHHFTYQWKNHQLYLNHPLWKKGNYLEIAVIGNQTARALARYGLGYHFCPKVARGEEMAKEWLALGHKGQILLMVGRHASHRIEAILGQPQVTRVEIYESRPSYQNQRQMASLIKANLVQGILLTSSLGVDIFESSLALVKRKELDIDILGIGQTTLAYLRQRGFKADCLSKDTRVESHIRAWIERERYAISKT